MRITNAHSANPDKHHMETDMEQEVTLDPEALKNELTEDEPLPDLGGPNTGGK